jgi:hypothetical protein
MVGNDYISRNGPFPNKKTIKKSRLTQLIAPRFLQSIPPRHDTMLWLAKTNRPKPEHLKINNKHREQENDYGNVTQERTRPCMHLLQCDGL